MKPERVRGVCFAITLLLFFSIRRQRGEGLPKKSAVLPNRFGTIALIASWCHPNSRLAPPFCLLVRGGGRGRFRPRSAAVLPPGRTGPFQPRGSLSGGPVCGVLLRRHRGEIHVIICVFSLIVKLSFRRGITAMMMAGAMHPPFVSGPRAAASRRLASATRLPAQSRFLPEENEKTGRGGLNGGAGMTSRAQ